VGSPPSPESTATPGAEPTGDPSRGKPRFIAVTIDCNDLEAMTAFWAALLDVEFQIAEPFGFLAHTPDRKVTLWLQRVPEGRVGKNRLHLDFVVDDLETSLERVRELGGDVGDQHTWREYRWQTCSDPEGNLFDIMQAPQDA
jgi:predicted enzyme related to lactoylglutathione lyase